MLFVGFVCLIVFGGGVSVVVGGSDGGVFVVCCRLSVLCLLLFVGCCYLFVLDLCFVSTSLTCFQDFCVLPVFNNNSSSNNNNNHSNKQAIASKQ